MLIYHVDKESDTRETKELIDNGSVSQLQLNDVNKTPFSFTDNSVRFL